MNNQRRIFLKNSAAAGALGLAISSGLLIPRTVMAAWPKKAFDTETLEASFKELFGGAAVEESSKVNVKAPEIAENGGVVPITVSSDMSGVESITILAPNNPRPLIAQMNFAEGMPAFSSVRIKMGKTGDVIGVVKANGKLYKASKNVKVTIGGCGG